LEWERLSLIDVKGWKFQWEGLLDKRCVSAVIPNEKGGYTILNGKEKIYEVSSTFLPKLYRISDGSIEWIDPFTDDFYRLFSSRTSHPFSRKDRKRERQQIAKIKLHR